MRPFRDLVGLPFVAASTRLLRQHRPAPSEAQVLVASGLAVGVGAGLGAIVFRYLIEGFTYVFFDLLRSMMAPALGPYAVVLLPALGGLFFGPLIYFFAREAKGHGVPEVMLAVAQRGGRIRPQVSVVKSLASALCIGSGGSVGREGPIVQIGSSLGSALGQALRMSDDRIRTLVACGAAGGIAATFNAPVAGVFFALEVILGEFTTRAFGIVVIASVTASVIGRAFFGNVPAFPVPPYEIVSLGEYGLYVGLGLLAGAVGVGFTRTLYWFEDRFDRIRLREYLKPVPGGLLLGGLGLFVPQVFGVGYPAMADALQGNYGFWLLLGLVVAKVVAVSLTIGSGGSGGVFAPSLFVGAMLGTAFGTLANQLWPGLVAPPGAYGLVGMAAVFSGAARAPITAVIILFELSGDYRIILPLMLAVVISTLVSEALSEDTIYTLKLRRRGIDLRSGRDIDLMRAMTVAQAMTPAVPAVAGEITVAEAAEQFERSPGQALVIVDGEGELEGMVTTEEAERAVLENKVGISLAEVGSRPVVTAFSDEPLSQAVHRMGIHDLRQLPVVSRENPRRPVGMLSRADVIRAYSQAVRHTLETQRGRSVPLRALRGMRVVEVPVENGSPLAGLQIRDLDLPGATLVGAIERDKETIVPRGDTRILNGDRLHILARDDVIAELHERLSALP